MAIKKELNITDGKKVWKTINKEDISQKEEELSNVNGSS
jgi:hypothetical protein